MLITIVALLWGILIYKLVSDLSDDPITAQSLEVSAFKAPKASQKEIIHLLPVERDPFFGESYIPRSNTKRDTAPHSEKETTPWPQITYKGSIQGERKSSYVVGINGQDHIMELGETINEVTLVRVTLSEASFKFRGKTKKFGL